LDKTYKRREFKGYGGWDGVYGCNENLIEYRALLLKCKFFLRKFPEYFYATFICIDEHHANTWL
jgi:hypothetical protein